MEQNQTKTPIITNFPLEIVVPSQPVQPLNISLSYPSPVVNSDENNVLKAPARFGLYRKNGSNPRGVIMKCNEDLKSQPNEVSLLYIRALAYYKLKKYRKAIADFSQILLQKPDRITVLYRRGVSYGKIEDIENAIADFSRILELDPGHVNASFYRASLKNLTNNFEEALEDYTNALRIDREKNVSSPRPNRMKRSESLKVISEKKMGIFSETSSKKMKDPSKKLFVNEEAKIAPPSTPPKASLHPEHPFSNKYNLTPTSNFLQTRYYQNGFLSRKRGYFRQAIEDFQRSIKARPSGNHSKAYFNIGYCYDKLEQYDNAIKYYSLSVSSDPKQHLAYYNRGIVRDKQGKYLEAIEDFTFSMLFDPENADFYHNRGFSFRKLGRLEDAIHDYSIAIQIDPNHFKAYHNRGYVYELMGNYTSAVEDYTKALIIHPGHVKGLRNRGSAYFNSGDFESAKQDFQNVIDIFSSLAESSNLNESSESLNLSTSSLNLSMNSSTLKQENSLLSLNSNSNLAMTYNLIGCCFEKQKQYEESLEYFSKAIELNGENPAFWYNQASSLRNLRRFEESLNCYTKAINLKESAKFSNSENVNTSFFPDREKKLVLEADEKEDENVEEVERLKRAFLIEASYYRGIIYRKFRKYNEAIEDLSVSLKNLEIQCSDSLYQSKLKKKKKRKSEIQKINKKSEDVDEDGDFDDFLRNHEIRKEDLRMFVRILKHRAFSYVKNNHFELGIEDYCSIIALDPKNIHAFNNRGIAYSMVGKTHLSVKDFKIVFELDPKNTLGFFQQTNIPK